MTNQFKACKDVHFVNRGWQIKCVSPSLKIFNSPSKKQKAVCHCKRLYLTD